VVADGVCHVMGYSTLVLSSSRVPGRITTLNHGLSYQGLSNTMNAEVDAKIETLFPRSVWAQSFASIA
jgi:hypothetical protein